jgi:hypothetical protein
MAQHDQVIENGSGAVVRADINAAFAAVFSSSSGAAPPTVTVPGQLWFDTVADTLNMRNATNTAWEPFVDDFDPANAYTKPAADARFAPIGTAYSKAASEARYEPKSKGYSKTEFDAKLNPLIDPIFAPSADLTKNLHFDYSLLGVADRAIRAPNVNTTLGGWELIENQQDFSGLTSRPYSGLGAFHALDIMLEAIPNSTALALNMQFSADNAASWISSAYYDTYIYCGSASGTAGGQQRTGLTSVQLTHSNAITGGTGGGMISNIKLWNFNRARWTRGRAITCYMVNANYIYIETNFGLPQATALNALKFMASDGSSLFNGNLVIHGLRG